MILQELIHKIEFTYANRCTRNNRWQLCRCWFCKFFYEYSFTFILKEKKYVGVLISRGSSFQSRTEGHRRMSGKVMFLCWTGAFSCGPGETFFWVPLLGCVTVPWGAFYWTSLTFINCNIKHYNAWCYMLYVLLENSKFCQTVLSKWYTLLLTYQHKP